MVSSCIKRVSIHSFTVAMLVVVCVAARAQSATCDEGVIRLPDRSGTIHICSALAAQVPQLSKQLADALRTLGSQQSQIKELTRLVQGINIAGKAIGPDRQAQMLKSLSTELARSQQRGDDRTRSALGNLGQQFDELRTQLEAALANQATSVATLSGLKGDVGNSIARLELSSASRQLDDISSKLGAIQNQVGDVKSDTNEIRKQLAQVAEMQLAERDASDAQRKAGEAQMQKMEERPVRFGQIRLQGSTAARNSSGAWPLSLMVSLARARWNDAELLVVGHPTSRKPWVLDATNKLDVRQSAGGQAVSGLLLATPGDLTICLSAHDPYRNRRVTLWQKFAAKLQPYGTTYHSLGEARIVLEMPEECKPAGAEIQSFVENTSAVAGANPPSAEGYVNFQKSIYRNADLRTGQWVMNFNVYTPNWRSPWPEGTQFLAVWSTDANIKKAIDFSRMARKGDVKILSDVIGQTLTICVVGPNTSDPVQMLRYVETHRAKVTVVRPGFEKLLLEADTNPRLVPENTPLPFCDSARARADKAVESPV